MKQEVDDLKLSAFGTQRIDDMSRDDLVDALNQMCFRYRMLCRERMTSSEVPVFHEDMHKWNEKLAEWFA